MRGDGDVFEMRFDRNTLCHAIRDLRTLSMPPMRNRLASRAYNSMYD